jgi:hypothetical protein
MEDLDLSAAFPISHLPRGLVRRPRRALSSDWVSASRRSRSATRSSSIGEVEKICVNAQGTRGLESFQDCPGGREALGVYAANEQVGARSRR